MPSSTIKSQPLANEETPATNNLQPLTFNLYIEAPMLIKAKTVGSMSVCCYIASCEETKKCVIIDPGGNEDTILGLCRDNDLTVEYIVNTHGHPDHVCGNAKIKEATGAPIVMHKDDAEFFARPDTIQYFSMLGLPQSPPPDKLVSDGDEIKFGKISLKVIHTPGHTPGGICLHNGPDLFTGDTLFVGGVGRTDFPGGDGKTLFTSIKNRLLVLADATVVWPGHGYGGDNSTIGKEKASNPYLTGDSF